MSKFNNEFDRVLSAQEVAQIMGRSVKTLWRWHKKEKCFPSPISIQGRCVGWRQSVIDAYLEQQSKEVI
ncbi:helix-turn-helix transcriptional regulator [Vibrio nereis]|uniref:helix-turn-helix transcriptional regulator n=1 Tax=Vibrio nereis TaxID=693 RepID=UPI0024958DD0|nr:helix-turn-helix domain-containing protein [Vibrio nereis]